MEKLQLFTPLAFFACSLLYRFINDRKKLHSQTPASISSSGEYSPPLPKTVTDVLNVSKLCHLATAEDGEPHLSLMNFTYHQPDEVIIMSTRRDTKKFILLDANPKVSLLIHDFPHLQSQDEGEDLGRQTCSITMNGTAYVVSDLDIDEKYRSLHRNKNPSYEQFIVGEGIAIFIVRIEKARICDVHDKVTYWEANKITI